MTLSETFALVSFTLFSYADLRYRLVPGIEVILVGAILLTITTTPIQTIIILFACAWGIFRNLSGWFVVPLLFYPLTWPVLFTSYAYRRKIIGRADLFAIGSLACLLPFTAVIFSLLGLEFWRRVWIRRQAGPIPAIPGLLLGLITFLTTRLLFQYP